MHALQKIRNKILDAAAWYDEASFELVPFSLWLVGILETCDFERLYAYEREIGSTQMFEWFQGLIAEAACIRAGANKAAYRN